MKFREHRGGLSESMETVVELDRLSDLRAYVAAKLWPWGYDDVELTVSKYTDNGDPRIGWKELYIVTVKNFGVIGWVDSNPEETQ